MMAAASINKLIQKIALYDDALAYRELFMLYHPRLVAFAATITHSRETAEEVVSDVFMKLWITRSNLLQVENFHLYIYVISKHFAINYRIKQQKQATFSLDEALVELGSFQQDPEQLLMTREMLLRVHRAIGELPPRCRLIFKLVKEDGLKYREVAELLHLSAKTVENQMTIALKKVGSAIRLQVPKTPA